MLPTTTMVTNVTDNYGYQLYQRQLWLLMLPKTPMVTNVTNDKYGY